MENNIELEDQGQRKEIVIHVSRAFKKYGFKNNSNIVLDNLNMTVEKGAIYGLLGPSGCGKTTLLTSIVGCKNLDSGMVWVLGGQPGKRGSGVPGIRLGYMPQETSLISDFTIEETFKYFGWLGGMTTCKIQQRGEELIKLLDLPIEKLPAGKLSGGEQRRLSLAIAIFHDPELLVLDEPTVGLDPLLRHNVWQYLKDMTRGCKTTVLMSTHYTEEAKGALKIGFMRKGRLLMEGSPEELLERYDCDRLEDVFLQLSMMAETRDDAETESSQNVRSIEFKEEILNDSAQRFPNSISPTSSIYKALIWKEALWYMKHKGITMAILANWILSLAISSIVLGHSPMNLHLAVVNKENMGHRGCDSVLSFDNGACYKHSISCIILKHLSDNKSYILDSFETMEDARLSVKKGRAWGVLYFNENFSKSLIERFKGEFDISTKVLQDSEIIVNLDMSNQAISTSVFRNLIHVFFEVIQNLQEQCELSLPARMNLTTIYGNAEPLYTHFLYPAMISSVVFLCGTAYPCGVLLMMKRDKLISRIIALGATMQQIIASFLLIQLIFLTVLIIISVVSGFTIFNMPCLGSLTLAIILLLLMGFSSLIMGTLLSMVIDAASALAMVVMTATSLLNFSSGSIWPLEGAHLIIKYLSLLLPFTYVITALRSIMLKGSDLSQPDVYIAFISTFCFILFFSTILVILLRLKKGF